MNLNQFSLDVKNLTIDRIRGLFAHSRDLIESDDMAYLFATGKSELEIRNALALYLHRNLEPAQHSLREWKRHDLAVVDSAGKPVLIIEGKVWAHSDVINVRKRTGNRNSIRSELVKDIKKLIKAKEKYPDVRCYITIILFSIDVMNSTALLGTKEIVKYAPLHRQGLTKYEILGQLEDEGVTKLIDLLSQYGDFMFLPMWEGSYHGMEMKSSVLILEPDFDKIKDL
jgi:hypothetical protein